MNNERYDAFSNERLVMGGDISVIIKDPTGLGRVLNSDTMMGIFATEETPGGRVLGGEVTYHPADDFSPRSVVATIDYFPYRKRTPKHDLSDIHAMLLRTGAADPEDIVSVTKNSCTDPGLLVSVGEYGNGMSIFVGSQPNEDYATGLISMSMLLPPTPDSEREQVMTLDMLLFWGIAKDALNTPKHLEGHRPTAIVVESMTRSDFEQDLWRVVVDYETFCAQTNESMPVLSVSQSDIEHLSAAYSLDSESLATAIDFIIEKHILASDVGSQPAPITIQALSNYFVESGR